MQPPSQTSEPLHLRDKNNPEETTLFSTPCPQLYASSDNSPVSGHCYALYTTHKCSKTWPRTEWLLSHSTLLTRIILGQRLIHFYHIVTFCCFTSVHFIYPFTGQRKLKCTSILNILNNGTKNIYVQGSVDTIFTSWMYPKRETVKPQGNKKFSVLRNLVVDAFFGCYLR